MAAGKAKATDKTETIAKEKVTYKVTFSPPAEGQLKSFDKAIQTQLIRRIEKLAADPRPPGVEKLKAEEDLYRIRSGDYRVIYTIQDKELIVLVVKIGNRKDVYRWLQK